MTHLRTISRSHFSSKEYAQHRAKALELISQSNLIGLKELIEKRTYLTLITTTKWQEVDPYEATPDDLGNYPRPGYVDQTQVIHTRYLEQPKNGMLFFDHALQHNQKGILEWLMEKYPISSKKYEEFAQLYGYQDAYSKVKAIFPHMIKLHNKTIDLTERGFMDEAKILEDSLLVLRRETRVYLTSDSKEAFTQLTQTCQDSINEILPRLNKHRGVKECLNQFLQCFISSKNIRQLAEFFTGNSQYFDKTDTEMELDAFNNALVS